MIIAPLHCHACGAAMPAPRAFAALDRLHGTPGDFVVAVCAACGSGVTTPIVGGDELGAYYPSGYGPYEDPANPVIRLISRVIRHRQSRRALATFPVSALQAAGSGRGVDVGCGRGDLAAALIGAGWDMAGVEPSPEAAANARSRGVDVRVGTLADSPLESSAYDAAVFQHSLEHTVEPLADLERICAALRPSGLVAITVPNFGSWQARRFRSSWYHLDVPRHRTHFTRPGSPRCCSAPASRWSKCERAPAPSGCRRASSTAWPGDACSPTGSNCVWPAGCASSHCRRRHSRIGWAAGAISYTRWPGDGDNCVLAVRRARCL